ncbi:hypothetical protein GQ53DRAFT_355050 [Thozetella sp. PMI_491]|nr:hypothetical protein GQ53DRAFT_355050 [Thozetella sp. PMI_491]
MDSDATGSETFNKLKACLACTTTKRKCSKEAPICHRCLTRGIECKYPLAKASAVYQSLQATVTQDDDFLALTESFPSDHAPARQSDETCLQRPGDVSIFSRRPWFLEAAYWEMSHGRVSPRTGPIDTSSLLRLVRLAQTWLGRWVTTGHCPFIHAQLYHRQLPECIQIAFAAVSAYEHRTPATTPIALRILASRSAQIVQQHAQQIDRSLDPSLRVVMMDTFNHLARTQALLAYLTILLFEGDITAQAQAEAQVDTLKAWSRQMWDSAVLDIASLVADGHMPSQDLGDGIEGSSSLIPDDSSLTSQWHAWIMAESVHRTYILASIVLDTYVLFRHGSAKCPGSVPITMRKGLWDHTSAYSWLQAGGSGQGPGVIADVFHDDMLFMKAHPDEVDEFTMAVLEATFGFDRLEQWVGEKGGRSIGSRGFPSLGTLEQGGQQLDLLPAPSSLPL